ncbi:MAG: MBL fold metallo-hydrolase [Prevotella sp.]|nr:MBL fold metallo-hydrolase [Prevotella sp.]
MIYTFVVVLSGLVVWQGHAFWMALGRQPRGERLERCKQSSQWKDGEFVNTHPTPMLTSNKGLAGQLWKFLFAKKANLRPEQAIPVVKTSLKDIPRQEEVCIWLGHSTVYIQTRGVRFLFDPVLTNKLPVWWFMRPFKGTDAYTVGDIPEVDYLVITHDHWDHLDWKTVRALKDRVSQVVCALGIGEHFEYWGYNPKKIHDVDWHDSIKITSGLTLRCLPARHFSGRLGQHKTLWSSFLIDGPRRIYVSGDGGYDERFRQIGQQYPGIDLAIMENGQYDEGWKYIHLLPHELPVAINDLGAQRVLTYHNSKYALGYHVWMAPLDSICRMSKGQPWHLLTPRIGAPIYLNQRQTFDKWW